MLVREVMTDAKTGEVTERWVEVPGVLTVTQGQAIDAENARQEGNARTLEQQADAALTVNKQIIADGNAWLSANTGTLTTAQLSNAMRQTIQASIKAAQQRNGVIRLLRQKFDATD